MCTPLSFACLRPPRSLEYLYLSELHSSQMSPRNKRLILKNDFDSKKNQYSLSLSLSLSLSCASTIKKIENLGLLYVSTLEENLCDTVSYCSNTCVYVCVRGVCVCKSYISYCLLVVILNELYSFMLINKDASTI